jgi:hypothetical protein
MTFSIQPEEWTAGYSFIPCGVESNITGDEFEYLIDVVYEKQTITNIAQISYLGKPSTEITCGGTHSFKRGMRVYIEDSNNKGYYIVRGITGLDKVVIDLILPNIIVGTDPYIYAYYQYKMPPSPSGRAELDLSPVLSDFVSRNIIATNSVYAAPDTRFEYSLRLGERSVYVFEFEDNAFTAGGVGFIQTGLTINDRPPFEIGDQIFIQQELTTVSWRYFDFGFGLEVGDPLGNPPIFNTVGQQLLLNSQTAPQYNGWTSVVDVLSQRLRLDIPNPVSGMAGNTVSVTGFVRPEYNGVHTVTDVIWNAGLSAWIVRTDLPWIFNSPTIPGTIRLANGQKSTRLDLFRLDDLETYNARWEKFEYNKSYERYIIDGICESDDRISSIYRPFPFNEELKYQRKKLFAPIQPGAMCHLLVHNRYDDATEGLWIETFDRGDNQLSLSFMKNNSVDKRDYYSPVGLLDMVNSPDLIDNIGTMSMVLDDIAYYVVWAGPEERICNNCCIEMQICYEDRGSTVCFQVNFERIDDNLFEGIGVIDGFTISYQISRFSEVSGWNLLQDDTFTIEEFGIYKELSECPNDMAEWGINAAFYDYWGEDAGIEIKQGTHCEEGEEECSCIGWSEKIPFLVDDCTRYTPWTIIFKDRRGSWAQYPFKLVSREFVETERTNFYQQEGTFTQNDFFYDPFNDRGEKSFVTRSREKLRLTSDWIGDDLNYIIKDMFKSAEIYIQNPDTGEIRGIMIDNKEYENKKDINDMLHQYEFDVNFTTDDWRI